MVVGELVHLTTLGVIDLPTVAFTSPLVATVLTVWPWGLAASAGALLLVGLRPVARITVDRRTAARLRRTGTVAIAKVMRASTPAPGPRAAVDASLLLRSPTGRIYSSDVHWTLDPVDAGSLRTGAVIPVRIDPPRGAGCVSWCRGCAAGRASRFWPAPSWVCSSCCSDRRGPVTDRGARPSHPAPQPSRGFRRRGANTPR
jgi:hypothetical protein